MTDVEIPTPNWERQVEFHSLLAAARKTWLIDALREALSEVDPKALSDQRYAYVPDDAHIILSKAGIPDEHVFPVPVLLEAKPTLVGYYRLLLGLPQKAFYGSGTHMGLFRSMEDGHLNLRQRKRLPAFCRAMCAALAEMVRNVSPAITPRDVQELPVLTLGQQFQGGRNNQIGAGATAGVFRSILAAIGKHAASRKDSEVIVRNAKGQVYEIALAGDPDVRIQQRIDQSLRNLVAIEIKGGFDTSNQYNRVGEAEKSHLMAKAAGYTEFWTIIHTKRLDLSRAKQSSPTTSQWFDAAEILAREGSGWRRFRQALAEVLGIPVDVD